MTGPSWSFYGSPCFCWKLKLISGSPQEIRLNEMAEKAAGRNASGDDPRSDWTIRLSVDAERLIQR